LFADYVVVTESPIDAAVIERLLEDAGKPADQIGISVVSVDGGVGKGSIDYMFHLLRGLQIDAAYVVDRDYFLPYKRGNRDSSLDSRGFPQYQAKLQPASLLSEIMPKVAIRKKLVDDLAERPSEALKTLSTLGFFCFMWALEVDLVNAATPRGRIFEQLQIPADRRSTRELLVNRGKVIKKQEVLLGAITGLAASALPYSYRALRRELPRLAEEARSR
jgi:putative ATP-dependent endonuclease of the OLD family